MSDTNDSTIFEIDIVCQYVEWEAEEWGKRQRKCTNALEYTVHYTKVVWKLQCAHGSHLWGRKSFEQN